MGAHVDQVQSKTKAWLGFWVGTMIFPIIGSAIGAILGHNMESAELKQARHAENAERANQRYDSATNPKAKADAAYEQVSEEYRVNHPKDKHLTAKGFTLGLVVEIAFAALFLTGVMGAVALCIGVAAFFGMGLAGWIGSKVHSSSVESEAKEAGKKASEAEMSRGAPSKAPSKEQTGPGQSKFVDALAEQGVSQGQSR